MSSGIGISIDPKFVDVQHKPDGMAEGSDSESLLMGVNGVEAFPDNLRIPRADRDDWLRENEKNQTAPEHYSLRFTHQGSSHECVYHCRSQLFEICYAKQLGKQWGFFTSPLFGYFADKGPRGQYGGSNVSESLRNGMSVGFLPEYDGPEWLGGKGGQEKRFLHTMAQTSGRSEDHWTQKGWPRALPEGYQQTARHFRILKAYWIPDAEAHFSAVVRWGVGNGRQGHSIPHVNIVKNDSGKYLSRYKDSYNRFLYDSEGLWGGGYCICSVTMPDDPSKPTGNDVKVAA